MTSRQMLDVGSMAAMLLGVGFTIAGGVVAPAPSTVILFGIGAAIACVGLILGLWIRFTR